jgi:hypothetical protein
VHCRIRWRGAAGAIYLGEPIGEVFVMTPLHTVLIAFVVIVVMMQLWDRL